MKSTSKRDRATTDAAGHVTCDTSTAQPRRSVTRDTRDAGDLRDALDARAEAERDRYYSWEQVKQGF